jgi:hypothetical protein
MNEKAKKIMMIDRIVYVRRYLTLCTTSTLVFFQRGLSLSG